MTVVEAHAEMPDADAHRMTILYNEISDDSVGTDDFETVFCV